jgi:integrase
MPVIALTDLSVNALKATDKQVKYFDAKLPAFGVRVGKHRKTFVVMSGADRKLVSLGHYPQMPLSEARKEAKKILAGVPRETGDQMSFADTLDEFLKGKKETLRPISHYQLTRILRRHFKWKKDLVQLTYEDVASVLDGIKLAGERSHALKDIRTFFNWCIPRYLKVSPCNGMKKPPQKSRDRVLTEKELAKVWHQAKKIGYPYGTIVQLLILTGQRSGETAAMRWEWISEDTLTIPSATAKNGHATIVPIGPMARAIIDGVPRVGDLLFPARGYDDKPFTGFGVMKITLDKCGVEKFTHHDLRRTASTMWAEIGIPQHINDRLLNHVTGVKQSSVARIYNRYEYLVEKREAIDLWEKRLREIIARANDAR